MIQLKELVAYLDSYLKIESVEDICWNGLQVEGKQKIGTIGFAVDAGTTTFEKANALGVDFLIVHHGMFWKYSNPSIAGVNRKRFEALDQNRISLYAVHLPLDKHRVVGNNAELLSVIGAKMVEDTEGKASKSIGCDGLFSKATSLEFVVKKLERSLPTRCKTLPFGSKKIKSVHALSGSASHADIENAIKRKIDLFITGEEMELYHAALDGAMHVIFAGHHATETVGLKALMKKVKKKFSVTTKFIDLPTGL